jgi:hypothetical protein
MPPTINFDFDQADAAQLVSSDPIGSAALNVTPVGLTLKSGFSIPTSDITLSPTSALSVMAFNSLDDADADGILLPSGAAGQPPRMLTLATEGAWLKYRLEANLKAAVQGSLAAAGFSIDGSAGVVLADYRFHRQRSETVRDGFLADVASGVRSAFDRAAVERLQPGDAVAIQAQGVIEAKVTVAFADLFTTQATALLALGGARKAIAFSITAGATATFDVRISDEFVITFAGVTADTWRIGVRKAKTRKVVAGVAAGIDVAATDRKQLTQFLDEIKDAIVGQSRATANDLVAKARLGTLNDAEQQLVRLLLERFGISNALGGVQELEKRLDAIDENATDALEEVANTKIKIGFAYEYARVAQNTQLLQMTVDLEHLRAFHGDVIRGDVGKPIASLAGGTPGVVVEQYLNQTTLDRTKSWGFTLGIGKWVDAASVDSDKLIVVTRRSVDDRVQESYLGTRGYEAHWQGDKCQWAADFRADMRGYSQSATPTLPEFDLGLHLSLSASREKLSLDDIDEYIDFAGCWGIVADDEIADRRAQASGFKETAQDVGIHLTIGDEVFRLLIPILAKATDGDLAFALALAMPRQPKIVGLRTPLERLAIYRRVWEFYLTHPDAGSEERQANAAAILKAEGQAVLADVERNAPRAHPLLDFTMSGRVLLDGDPLDRWRTFRNGATVLQQAIVSGGPAETPLDRARRSMQSCWAQVHHLRAIGALLVDRARIAGVLPKIGRSFTITPQKPDGTKKAMVIVA